MADIKKIFEKQGGKELIKRWWKAGVLPFAVMQTLSLGFSRKSLEILRLSVDNRIYAKLKKKNKSFIAQYVQEHPADASEKKRNPIIWTIWLQGMDQAPEVVQKCYASMQKHITDREIVVITEDNYSDYVTFPEHIMEKYQKGIISKVHFSDLLRIELLYQHGGTWLDGTVFCSDAPFQPYILDSELFLFQTLKPGLDGHCRALSSWLMTAYSHNPVIALTRALLHNYWKKYNYPIDYFILHDFMQMAIEAYPEVWRKVVPFSNSVPHILLLRLFEEFDPDTWQGIKNQTSFHKLTHKFAPEDAKRSGTYYDCILNNQ